MARYIDKDRVIEEISRLANRSMVGEIDEPYLDWKTVVSVIFDTPTADVVEIVRCKDCAVPHNRWTGCPKLNGLVTPSDFYCAFGERSKEVEDSKTF